MYWSPRLEGWVLTRHADIRAVLSDRRTSVNRQARVPAATPPAVRAQLRDCHDFMARWMIFSDPPGHGRLRSVVRTVFTPDALRTLGLEEFVGQTLAELLAPARRTGQLEVMHGLAYPLTRAVSARLIGVPAELLGRLAEWSENVFRLFGSGLVTEETVRTAHRSLVECRQQIRQVLAERRAGPSPDLLGLLTAALADGRIVDQDEIVASAVMLMIGGHESVAMLIGNGLHALLRHPDQLARFAERAGDVGWAQRALDELMRFDGPSVSLLRRTTADLTVGGTDIPAGQFVFPVLRAGNRDPAAFREPHRLDLERAPSTHLGLGHGVHFCVGAPVARLQAVSALRELVRLGPQLAAAELDRVPSLATSGPRTLPIRLRHPGIRRG